MTRFQITTMRTQEVFLNCTLVGHESLDADRIKEMIEHGEFFLKGSDDPTKIKMQGQSSMKIVDEMGNPVLLIDEVKDSPRESDYNLCDVRVEEMT